MLPTSSQESAPPSHACSGKEGSSRARRALPLGHSSGRPHGTTRVGLVSRRASRSPGQPRALLDSDSLTSEHKRQEEECPHACALSLSPMSRETGDKPSNLCPGQPLPGDGMRRVTCPPEKGPCCHGSELLEGWPWDPTGYESRGGNTSKLG